MSSSTMKALERRRQRDLERAQLKAEALGCLRAYLAGGVEGVRRQGLDRVQALGIDPARCCGTPDEIRHLVAHVERFA